MSNRGRDGTRGVRDGAPGDRRRRPGSRAARALVTLGALSALLVGGAGAGVAVAAKAKRTGSASSLNRHAFKGTNAQGLRVALSAVRRSFGGRTFTYQATMSCSDGTTFTDAPFSDDVILRKGRFRVSYSADRGATKTVVRGTVTRKRASGLIRIVEFYGSTPDAGGDLPLQAGGPVRCDSGNIRWTAR